MPAAKPDLFYFGINLEYTCEDCEHVFHDSDLKTDPHKPKRDKLFQCPKCESGNVLASALKKREVGE